MEPSSVIKHAWLRAATNKSKEYQQVEGINYQDTFSPVMDMTTARIIFALGVIWGNPPRDGDIPVAYTRASPEDNLEIYLYPPQGMRLTAEFVSAARGVQEAMGCYHLVKELGLNIQLSMRLRMNNG